MREGTSRGTTKGVIFGPDCSVVSDCLLGLARGRHLRLVFIAGHSDSRASGGLDPADLTSFLTPLVGHPRAIGMEMTIYHSRHDHDGSGAALLAGIIEDAFMNATT